MRLNKSFIVRRSVTGLREQLAAFTLTSAYIHHSLEEGASVWIAQREGRAKDGQDRTDPAIIKMFFVSQRKGSRSFPEVMSDLSIVPVAASYELSPCDVARLGASWQSQRREGAGARPSGHHRGYHGTEGPGASPFWRPSN